MGVLQDLEWCTSPALTCPQAPAYPMGTKHSGDLDNRSPTPWGGFLSSLNSVPILPSLFLIFGAFSAMDLLSNCFFTALGPPVPSHLIDILGTANCRVVPHP